MDTKTPGALPGWRGLLESEPLNGNEKPYCFRFWYHIQVAVAANAGKLNVWKKDVLNGNLVLIWSLKNSILSDWREASFTYQDYEPHRIIFEGIRGASVSDISIDDITILRGSECGFFPEIAKPSGVITDKLTTTTSKPLSTYTWLSQSEYDCNFEEDFCNWSNDKTAEFNWTRSQGPTISPNTGTKIN